MDMQKNTLLVLTCLSFVISSCGGAGSSSSPSNPSSQQGNETASSADENNFPEGELREVPIFSVEEKKGSAYDINPSDIDFGRERLNKVPFPELTSIPPTLSDPSLNPNFEASIDFKNFDKKNLPNYVVVKPIAAKDYKINPADIKTPNPAPLSPNLSYENNQHFTLPQPPINPSGIHTSKDVLSYTPLYEKSTVDMIAQYALRVFKEEKDLIPFSDIEKLRISPKYSINNKASVPDSSWYQNKETFQFIEEQEDLSFKNFYNSLNQEKNCVSPLVGASFESQKQTPWCYAFSAGRALNPLLDKDKISYYYLATLSHLSNDYRLSLLDGGDTQYTLIGLKEAGYYYSDKDLPLDYLLSEKIDQLISAVWNEGQRFKHKSVNLKGERYSISLNQELLQLMQNKRAEAIQANLNERAFKKSLEPYLLITLHSLANMKTLPKKAIPKFSIEDWRIKIQRGSPSQHPHVGLFYERIRSELSRGHRLLVSDCAQNINNYNPNPKTRLALDEDYCNGHAISLVGLFWDSKNNKCMTQIENSWGEKYGKNGTQMVPLETFLKNWQSRPNQNNARGKQLGFTIAKATSTDEDIFVDINEAGEICYEEGNFKRLKEASVIDGKFKQVCAKKDSLQVSTGIKKEGNFLTTTTSNLTRANGSVQAKNTIIRLENNHLTNIDAKLGIQISGTLFDSSSKLKSGTFIHYNDTTHKIASITHGERNIRGELIKGLSIHFNVEGKISSYQEGIFSKTTLVNGITVYFYPNGKIRSYKMLLTSGDKQLNLYLHFDESSKLVRESFGRSKKGVSNIFEGYVRTYQNGKHHQDFLINNGELKHLTTIEKPSRELRFKL